MKEKCICTTFKLSVAAVAGVALASVAFAEGQKTRPAGNPLSNKSPQLEQRAALKRENNKARADYNKNKAAHANAKLQGGIAGPGTCPNPANNCCAPGNGTPGCSDASCCTTVCTADPFCCNTAWDGICASEANSQCPALCGGGGGNPACGAGAGHDCCTTGGPGCTDTACCNSVCTADPFCCSVAWDGICKGEAQSICGIVCVSCPNPAHDCCTTGSPGCSDTACCEAVCAADPFCCSVAWDVICKTEVATFCANPCPSPCDKSNPNDCFSGNSTPGCNNVDCCNAVCCVDSFCCLIAWDSICASEAALICGPPCDATCPDNGIIEPEACGDDTDGGCNSLNACAGASGTCCVASFGLGCSDTVCQNSVCSYDSFCCAVAWDSICASEACSDANCACDPAAGDPFVHINCGDTICGTMWADGNIRDTDWYKFCLHGCGATVNWSVSSEVPAVAFILNSDCGALQLLAQGSGNCPVRAEANLTAGNYIAFTAPAAFNCYPCGGNNDYTATLTCIPPVVDEACPGDIAGGPGNGPNGTVDVDDLLKVINNWGPCPPLPPCE